MRQILCLSVLILFTGCGATIEIQPEKKSAGKTGTGHQGGAYPEPVGYPAPVAYPAPDSYPVPVSYPGDYQSSYPNEGKDSGLGSIFKIKITSR